MATPLEMGPGLIFDARTLFIGIGSAFGGVVVAAVSGAIAIAYRLSLGGAGARSGSAVILTSALVGAGFYWLQKHNHKTPGVLDFLLFGFVLHLVALPWYFVIPDAASAALVHSVGIAMLLTFVPATALLCMLMADIETRTAERAALIARDADYRGILDNMTDVFYRTDADGIIVRVSPSVTQVLGYLPGELVGRAITEIYCAPEDRANILAALDAGGGTVRDYEVSLRGKDGRKVLMSKSSHYLYDTQGRISGVEGIGRDISERKQAEARVHALAERPCVATRAGELGNWDHDLASGTIVWDRKMCELYGLPGDGYTGTPAVWKDRVHPDDLDRLQLEIEQAIEKKGEFSTTFRLLFQDGRIRHLEAFGLVSRNADGTPQRLIGINRDISEKLEAERRLVESQKLEMVGLLTGGIAHDFNNLLAVIIGNLEFMDDHVRRGTTLDSLKDGAMRATLRGADLTQRLLAFSRKQTLRPEAIDTNKLILELSELMRRTLGDDIEIDCRLAEGVNRIMIDPGQLENALLNLAINARDAMPDGGRITIATRNEVLDAGALAGTDGEPVTPGPYVVISTSDTGTGMPASVREHVFEPFFTTKETGKGSGLGLSMVYGFVRQSGGHVAIDSGPGEGTVIRLYLPRTKLLRGREPALPASQTLQLSGTENVLVVEDDPAVLIYLTTALRKLGYQVSSASDGPTAVDMLDDLPPLDLLVTDLVMPNGMNGLDIAESVRKRHPGVRVLYTSGYADREIGGSDNPEESAAFLAKPYKRAVLAQVIRQLLDAA